MKTELYATETPNQRAAVVHVSLPDEAGEWGRSNQAKLDEAINLCTALSGVDVIFAESVQLNKIQPKTLIGGGKVEELAQKIEAEKIDVAVINTGLSPSQQRNLELALQCKVIDRTGLILEIFAERARTKAGQLQVELAQQDYQASRLVRSWTHLERQRGGLGKTGGPGERQIEIDRRLIKDRITFIRRELEQVEKERALHRRARTRAGTPVVALVGYTNAGKSTLFNAIVGEKALAKDMLFATLDPLMRKMQLPSGKEAILSDTVGFVSDLPHELVEAFKATLEEVANADVLLQVHDIASEDSVAQAHDVAEVLQAIGVQDIPVVHVLNKADMLETPEISDNLLKQLEITEPALLTSALTRQGVDAVKAAIDKALAEDLQEVMLEVPFADGRAYAWLHAHGEVVGEELDEERQLYRLKVKLSQADIGAFHILCQ